MYIDIIYCNDIYEIYDTIIIYDCIFIIIKENIEKYNIKKYYS